MTRAKRTKRKKNRENGDPHIAPEDKKSKMSIQTEPLLSNMRGFLISYDCTLVKGTPHEDLINHALQLLNTYADKVLTTNEKICRTDKKTYYFKHRQNTPTQTSPFFIETDVEDPSVIVDAIYTDLMAPTCEDIKTAQFWSRILPVKMTCSNEYADILDNAKTILEPLLEEDKKTKIKLLFYGFKDKKDKLLFKELRDYLGSKGVLGDGEPDLAFILRSYDNICCISVARNYSKFKRYAIRDVRKDITEKLHEEKSDVNDTQPSLHEQCVQPVKTPEVNDQTTEDITSSTNDVAPEVNGQLNPDESSAGDVADKENSPGNVLVRVKEKGNVTSILDVCLM